MKILIMGLPGSGKTTLARHLVPMFNAVWLNADEVRKEADDWDFSAEGRTRQANRMKNLAEEAVDNNRVVVADFVCPTETTRKEFDADYTIWMDTVKSSQYEDTDKAFEPPKVYDLRIDKYLNDNEIKEVANKIRRYRSSMMLDSMNRPHTMDIE